jgi:hypothetical protein
MSRRCVLSAGLARLEANVALGRDEEESVVERCSCFWREWLEEVVLDPLDDRAHLDEPLLTGPREADGVSSTVGLVAAALDQA